MQNTYVCLFLVKANLIIIIMISVLLILFSVNVTILESTLAANFVVFFPQQPLKRPSFRRVFLSLPCLSPRPCLNHTSRCVH